MLLLWLFGHVISCFTKDTSVYKYQKNSETLFVEILFVFHKISNNQ